MAIDLRNVEPLGSKSVLLEQAMRRQKEKSRMGASANYFADMEEDAIDEDFKWLKDDQSAIRNLVSQMDSSVGQLAQQLNEVEGKTEKSKKVIEKEQQLLFKQIHTLNGLLKRQVDVFEAAEQQVAQVEFQQNRVWMNVGIGVLAGLASAITIVAASPLAVMFLQHLNAG